MRNPALSLRSVAPACEHSYAEAEHNGQALLLDPAGALYLPDHGLLCVSDLHLEKGAAYARRGQFLPPWDTFATLRILQSAIARHDPKIVVTLGDNFHDRRGSAEMPDGARMMIREMVRGREWIWISGNHDPDGVAGLPGVEAETFDYAGLHFRHEPERAARPGEVAGHLHPAAVLVRRARGVRRPCFAADGRRIVMPSFGVMTGGLDLRHKAFQGLFDKSCLVAHMLGDRRVHSIAYGRLSG
ncbi:MAG: ligase-associated DNA damage response endonuclease PdeM [Rhizobiaceae bacterium]|nr:ligase-associated DNA damage response endonuclease PdeM [Rhizobiaceae bacterium]